METQNNKMESYDEDEFSDDDFNEAEYIDCSHLVNKEAFFKQLEKMSLINKCIEEGKEIPYELRKNFVTFPLSGNPFEDESW